MGTLRKLSALIWFHFVLQCSGQIPGNNENSPRSKSEVIAYCDQSRNTVEVPAIITTLYYPVPVNTPCTFRFRKEHNVCQIRLDFEVFDTAPANQDGICETDLLRITNSINIPSSFATCGNLQDQHMYLTFGSQDSIEVTPIIRRTSSKYKIIATRIFCSDSRNRAPDYCLQYFTQPTGQVKSFDFGVQQQSNQMYTVCVKPISSSQRISWKTCQGNSFNIVSESDTGDEAQICNTDWVQVKGLNRACQSFGEQQISSWKPYELLVNFDQYEYPPPPPSFNMPTDSMNCPEQCLSPPGLDCACISTGDSNEQSCACIVTGIGYPPADFNNTGFCVEYTQQ